MLLKYQERANFNKIQKIGQSMAPKAVHVYLSATTGFVFSPLSTSLYPLQSTFPRSDCPLQLPRVLSPLLHTLSFPFHQALDLSRLLQLCQAARICLAKLCDLSDSVISSIRQGY